MLFIPQPTNYRHRAISKEATRETRTTEESQTEDIAIDGNQCSATEGVEKTEIDEPKAKASYSANNAIP